jgi:hypothetical protein
LLPICIRNKDYIFLCVCLRVGKCVRVCECICASVCLRACSLTHPACNEHAQCNLRPFWLHHNFRHLLKNGTIFLKKKLLNIKCVFWFSLQLLFETFLILRRIKRDIVISVETSLCKVPVILVGF